MKMLHDVNLETTEMSSQADMRVYSKNKKMQCSQNCWDVNQSVGWLRNVDSHSLSMLKYRLKSL